MHITKADLTEALTGFRLSVTALGGSEGRGQVTEPDVVADALEATLSRITAERHPGTAGSSPLETTARHFAATWAELAASLPSSYDCHLNCVEANAMRDLLEACGLPDAAAEVLAEHAARDDDGDEHYTPAAP